MKNKRSGLMAITVVLTVAASLAMIIYPEVSVEAVKDALSLWLGTVVPALLPFFICVGLMMHLGLPQRMARFFEKPVRRFFNVPGDAAFAFIMSVSSGYPVGAKIIATLREQREITKVQAERMMTFCSTSGPLFMLGAVGVGMLGNVAAGWVIAIAHYLGAVLNGMVFRHHGSRQETGRDDLLQYERTGAKEAVVNGRIKLPHAESSIVNMLTESIYSAFKTLLLICGYIVIFMLIIEFLDVFSFFALFSTDILKGMAKGFFEVTVGCDAVSFSDDMSLIVKCAVCSAIISWGGISTHFQVASILGKTDVDMGFYVKAKLCHGLFSAMLALGMGSVIFKIVGTSVSVGTFCKSTLHPGVFGEGFLAAGGLGMQLLTTAEKTQIFINKLLFSSQMIIMVLILFAVVSIVGMMFYQITCFLKMIYKRVKNAGQRRKREREESRRKGGGNNSGVQSLSQRT